MDRISHPLRIQAAHFAPELFPVFVKVNKGGSEFKVIDRCQLTPDLLLDVEADEQDFIANFVL